MPTKNKAFTLVELIVVIVILAILATISFLSYNSYSASARNSSRLADLRNISKALELYKTNGGKYPDPSSGKQISFSGGEIWSQGTFGTSVRRVASSISSVPVDPLYNVEYTYSTINTRSEFQLSAITEGNQIVQNDFIPFDEMQNALAAGEIYQAMTMGTYNGMTAKVFTGGIYYVLAVPSIIIANPPYTIVDGTGIQLVKDGQGNLPSSYLNTILTLTGGNQFKINVVLTGSSLDFSTGQVVQMVKNLQAAYSGSMVAGGVQYQNLLNIDPNNSSSLLSFGSTVVTKQLGGNVVMSSGTGSSGTGAGNSPPLYSSGITYTPGQQFTYAGTRVTVNGNGIGYGDTTGEPGCSSPDIVVWKTGYNPIILAACNIGSTIAGVGAASYGNYIQWGRNDGLLTAIVANNDWQSPQNNNAWGGASGVASFDLLTASDKLLMKGPCQPGYHVPIVNEWSKAALFVTNKSSGWNGTDISTLVTALSIPYSGFRYASMSLNTFYQAQMGTYWTSTPGNLSAYNANFNPSSMNFNLCSFNCDRADGLPVRCFKDY